MTVWQGLTHRLTILCKGVRGQSPRPGQGAQTGCLRSCPKSGARMRRNIGQQGVPFYLCLKSTIFLPYSRNAIHIAKYRWEKAACRPLPPRGKGVRGIGGAKNNLITLQAGANPYNNVSLGITRSVTPPYLAFCYFSASIIKPSKPAFFSLLR